MAFCPKCGASVAADASFCPSCGNNLAAAAAGTPATPVTPGPPPPPLTTGSTALSSNVAATLSYVLGFITGIIFLVLEPYKNDRFVRFHAFQSIFFSVVWIAFSIVWGVITATFIFGLGGLFHLFWMLWVLVRLALLVIWIVLMYKAYNREMFMLPVIGPMAAKQAGV
jgi:uncharacterized membrane protein